MLFIWCAVYSSGIVRVAFAIGAVASVAPMLAGRAEHLLFDVIGLPTMSAGSVVAGAVTTLLFTLPMVILFILLACGRRVPRGCRWLSLASILIVLGTAFYPIYVTVLAFLLKPGDPAVGRMIEVSSQVIKLRYILPGLSFLLMSFISMRFARAHPLTNSSESGFDRVMSACPKRGLEIVHLTGQPGSKNSFRAVVANDMPKRGV